MLGEEVFTVKEVATLLKVGEKTVYSMAQAGELPAFKVRGQWRFARKDIDTWIEQQKHTTHDFGEEKVAAGAQVVQLAGRIGVRRPLADHMRGRQLRRAQRARTRRRAPAAFPTAR